MNYFYITGALFDATGNYLASFYLAGVVILLSGLICLPLRRISRWEKEREEKKGKIKGDTETALLDREINIVTVNNNTKERGSKSGAGC